MKRLFPSLFFSNTLFYHIKYHEARSNCFQKIFDDDEEVQNNSNLKSDLISLNR